MYAGIARVAPYEPSDEEEDKSGDQATGVQSYRTCLFSGVCQPLTTDEEDEPENQLTEESARSGGVQIQPKRARSLEPGTRVSTNSSRERLLEWLETIPRPIEDEHLPGIMTTQNLETYATGEDQDSGNKDSDNERLSCDSCYPRNLENQFKETCGIVSIHPEDRISNNEGLTMECRDDERSPSPTEEKLMEPVKGSQPDHVGPSDTESIRIYRSKEAPLDPERRSEDNETSDASSCLEVSNLAREAGTAVESTTGEAGPFQEPVDDTGDNTEETCSEESASQYPDCNDIPEIPGGWPLCVDEVGYREEYPESDEEMEESEYNEDNEEDESEEESDEENNDGEGGDDDDDDGSNAYETQTSRSESSAPDAPDGMMAAFRVYSLGQSRQRLEHYLLAHGVTFATNDADGDEISLGARVPRNEWEHLRNISRSGSILLHCNQQIHLWNI